MKATISKNVKSGEMPFVSIILPTHVKYPDFKEDAKKLSKLLQEAIAYINMKYSEGIALQMKSRINALAEGIDFNFHSRSKGLGLFISPDTSRVVHFPFAVKEKIIVTDIFENRDLVLAESYQLNYLVLTLSEKHIRLFKCKGIEMDEVKDKNFPAVFIDEFDEPKPSRGDSWDNTLKGMKKDKSVIKEERFTDFLREIDKKLAAYLNTETKLIVSGGTKNISDFEKVSKNLDRGIAKIPGNYNYDDKAFYDLVWKHVMEYFQTENGKVLKQFIEAEGTGNAVCGIESVWEAAQEGKGLTLLVEKDFMKPGFLGEDKFKLFTHPPVSKHKIITDAVNNIIQMVLEKNGKVIFLDNGALNEYDNIGLLLRYK